MKYNTIILSTLLASETEQALKYAERILRRYWNMYGFKRIGSGFQTILTDGFGNPYSHERMLKVFSIAIEVPETMDYHVVETYLLCGVRRVNCYADIYYANT